MPWLLQIHTRLTPDNCLVRFPGIYEVKIFGAIEAVYGETEETIVTLKYPGVPQMHPDIIGSVRLGANDLDEASTDAALFSTFGAYRYDYVRGAVLINAAKYSDGVAVEGHQSPYGQRLVIGIIVGYCDTVDYTREDKSTYNGIFHDTRIKALPTLSSKMDDLDYGFQVFNDWSVSLIGVDGEFEGINHTGIIAKLLSVPEGGELASAKTVAHGRITKTADGDDFAVTIGDIKRTLDNVASCGRLSKDLFPYLDDGDVGKIVPLYWNKQTAIEPICLNKTEDLSDSYSSVFRYCIGETPDSAHTIKRVDRVYTAGSEGTTEIAPGYAFGSPISTGIRRADKLAPTLYLCASPRTVIPAGWGYETAIQTGISAADVMAVTGSENGILTRGTDYTLSGTSIILHDSAAMTTTAQTITIDAKTVDLEAGRDYTVATDADGFASVTLISGGAISGNGYAITVSASSDDNGGADIEAPVASWTATLRDDTLKMAYIPIPASVALSGGDAPIDIKVDLFGWSNQTAGETEWLIGADIIRDALVMFGGYRYESENFDLQSWEIERVKCSAKGIHVSPRIEDDTTITDIIGQVAKSTLMLCTSRPDGRYDLKVDSLDVYPEWQIESFQRMETPSPAIDLSQAFSSIKIQYGTAGDSDKKTYLDTTYEADIQAVTDVRRVKEIDTIISDEESAKQYASMVYERIFDLDTFRTRPLIEIKVPLETYIINICPTKAFLAPRTRDGSKWAAYTVTAVSRALGDEQITVTGRWRYDIEFDQTYTQGVICDDCACDGAVIGATTIDAA